MELEEDDDDLVTIIAIYCLPEIENPSPIELFAEIAEPNPIQVSHHDPNDDFSNPDLDDILEDIDEKGSVEGENANPYSVGNTSLGIFIRNNPGSFMTDVDLDTALTREFPKHTNIVPAHLLDNEFDDEELFVGQQFDNKKDCLHAIKQLSLKLDMDYKTQMWMIRKLEGPHTCTSAQLPTIQVSVFIADMQAQFKYKVLYRKVWWEKQMAMQELYGDWVASYNEL
ncbi:hypothetical protein GOBAR_AA11844 [Gossypium barbadense]|uniref:Transposase MuDR plant domain-containing protein n=1 Tax=Gossypium barbadense TaxID=3634 RepID=A0A2P5XZL6_GOSBA|nr:hypothetical protein GOBAR_AA11844 [Gossypium barbadense]